MRKAIHFIFIIIIFLLLLLQGCSANPSVFLATGTPTPTELVCPPIAFNTPVLISQNVNRPYLVVILFQNNSNYKPYLLDAFDRTNAALESGMQPGDRLFMLDMNAKDFDSAVVAMVQVKNVSVPLAPPAPTIYPTITATLPSFSTPQSVLAQQAATQSANATVVSIGVESTKSAFIHNCSYQSWNDQYLAISQEWEKEKDKSVQDFIEELEQEQSKIEIGNEELGNQVWEGLSHASLIMENECDKFDRCILIVFSDMYESRSVKPEKLNINLQNVEILNVMLNCPFLYSGECGKWIEAWKKYLFSNDINARSVDFINGENLAEILSAILRR